ncbi:MAG: gliding motility-associated C-terminal domain-containing protein [Sediminicola sp.]
MFPKNSPTYVLWSALLRAASKLPRPDLLTFTVVTLVFFGVTAGFAQLSDLHYLPPLKQHTNNNAIIQQAIYLSTPETEPFDVEVFQGTGTVPLTTLSISNTAPAQYRLGDGDNNITLVSNPNTGAVLSGSGLRFQSAAGQRFYVNYRGRSTSQAGSLTSKGRQALGTAFKWGGLPNYLSNSTTVSTSLGIMATEDNTIVDIFGYDPGCRFRLGNDPIGITDDVLQISLNAGESYVLEAIPSASLTANIDGWLGASIRSNKKISVSNGALLLRAFQSGGGWDVAIDQPIPENVLGKEYVFVRGNGVDYTEFAVIIATQNNTQVFVNGSTDPFATIQNGDYVIVPGTNYSSSSGGNMYVTASNDIYAYQCIAGSTNDATVDMNFISPVNCLMPSNFDNIPSINDVVGLTVNGGITIVASASIPNAEIVVTAGAGTFDATTLVERTVEGSSEWKTFYAPGLSGNVSVKATGPIAVGFLGASGVVGIGGYFSGFDTVPVIELNITGGGCLPGATMDVTEGFSSYEWFRDGVPIPDEAGSSFTPTVAGDYYVRVTQGSCTYESAVQSAYDCNPEIVVSNIVDSSDLLEGDTVTFTVGVEFLGFDPITDLVITDQLPEGLTLLSATPSFGTWNSPNWTIGTMRSGEEHTLTLVATVDEVFEDIDLINTVTNTQNETDGNTIADTPTVQLSITNSALSVTKQARPAADGSYGTLEELIIYDLVVTNTGSTVLSNIGITDLNADSGSIVPNLIPNLEIGETTTFTAGHTITEDDLDQGSVTNSATATALLTNGHMISDSSDNPQDTADMDTNGDGDPDDPTITIMNNRAPSNIFLSNDLIAENNLPSDTVGFFTSMDPDMGDTANYTLVAGDGDTYNDHFAIASNGELFIRIAANYEVREIYSIRVRITDSGNLFYEAPFSITVTDVNDSPTAIGLSNHNLPENSAIGTLVGNLSATDEDVSDTHTYTLIAGDGTNDADNGSFTVSGNSLELAVVPDFEVKASYSVYINVNDGINDHAQGFVIDIADVNEMPTALALSNTGIEENSPIGTVVGSMATTDGDASNTFIYNLAEGDGTNDADNGSFTINGNSLELAEVPDFEVKASYSVYINVNDGANDYAQAFTIDISDVNEAPISIALANNGVPENSPIGSPVGNLSTTDMDAFDTHTYSLAVGDGTNDADNGSFTINGNSLELAVVPDFEVKASYSVYINVNDGANNYAQAFTIDIADVNEGPISIALSNHDIPGNSAIGTIVGSLSTTDADVFDTHTYNLVAGDGSNDADNGSFTINGSSLELAVAPNFGERDSYSIRIRSTDQQGLFVEEDFLIVVVEEAAPPMISDQDGDGVADSIDECPNTLVGNTVGPTGCSSLQLDTDGDGILDVDDNCPLIPNPGQDDVDRDGTGDVCDILELNVSEAITPNGDGINDTWIIINITNYHNSVVRVYNQWGNEVFSAIGYQNDWDGTYRDRQSRLPESASYYYQIDLEGDGPIDKDGWLYITE